METLANPGDFASDDPQTQNVFSQIRVKKSTRQLPIWGTDLREYIQGDNTRHAFSTFYKSWKTTIMDTFKISDKEFNPTYKETPGSVLVTVFSPKINANAQLHPWAFKIALLSQDYKGPRLVGDNTMSFRHAVMVMLHKGYKVHMESSGYIFNFEMHGVERLTCSMTTSRKEPPRIGIPTKHLTTYMSRIGKDVIIRIGPVFGLCGSRVPKNQFISWLGVAISIRHFRSPSELIETGYGDIILDSKYANKIYHNGVLSQNTLKGETFQYGYNFRQKGQETVFLSVMWETAIQQNPEVALPRYIDLLRSNSTGSDTKEADELLEFSTAELIWNQLLSDAGQEEFYYCNEQGSNDAEVIKEHLGKYPTPIPTVLWNLLRRHSLIRTANEERNCHPGDPERTLSETTFSKTIQRVLRAGLMLSEDTKEITTVFVNTKDIEIGVQYNSEQNVLEISGKWLCFDTIHKHEPCAVTNTMDPDNLGSNSFICDYIAESLLELVLDKLDFGHLVRGWRRRFVEKLRQMPREITAEQGFNAKEIVITWKDGATHLFSTVCGKNIQYHVTLHEEKCWNKALDLLHESGIQETALAPCGCAQKLVSQEMKTVTFGNLDPSRKYFPMVAENGERTFYGIPHERIQPSEHSKFMELDKKLVDVESSSQNDTNGI
ncbi:hypothetical protein PHISCL_06227 [Aspergillus sclerotialis]|uniref:Uncharacterized protein n=1 Tax=Aspergillus sclerotialis TaxID=2070753 RepID=A0A3A2ZER4_9EURO|nr:hypothetical protein PHISCL_06227 [Aspergillus sclerotialis]